MSKKNTRTGMEADEGYFHLRYRLYEGALLLALTASIFLLISLFSYHGSDPGWSNLVSVAHVANAGGRFGAWLSDLMLYLCGYVAYLFPFILCYSAWLFYRHKYRDDGDQSMLSLSTVTTRLSGFLLVLLTLSGLLSMHVHTLLQPIPFAAGGILGNLIGTAMLAAFNDIGSTLILMTIFLIGVTLFTGVSWLYVAEWLGSVTMIAVSAAIVMVRNIDWRALMSRIQPEKAEKLVIYDQGKVVEDKTKARLLVDKASKLMPFKQNKSADAAQSEASAAESIEASVTKALSQPPRYSHSKVIPKLSLLSKLDKQAKQLSHAELEACSQEVEARLADFGVQATVVAVHPGPVVTRYELELAAGTKASKITGLAKDLARSLSVISVRVVEVIPGKSVIGIELPNQHRAVVTLREVLASPQYEQARSPLSLALGKDIAGNSVVVDLAKMPHLLVAGTTGSGKSVSLNAMLLSLLYKSTPEEMRLLLIDPKMLELSIYDGIPHLLTPVVTDMKDAATALRWCVIEMERRYRLMASLGVRNIAGYNDKVRIAEEKGKPLMDPLAPPESPQVLEKLPYIVVLADEFADMMVVVGKKVETLIARLAQKARAAGVHLIFATQRPSVDVITGLIKANIPTRIAFQVSQKIDSRTILDQQGAEQLLGHGDMLYLAPGTGIPVRVHGAFVQDDEVHRVVAELKANSEPEYIDDILDEATSSADPTGYTEASYDDPEKDALYDQAVEFVVQSRRVSISSIQRRFKIGYNRSARIVEAMEAAGVVSTMEGNGSREVLVPEQARD